MRPTLNAIGLVVALYAAAVTCVPQDDLTRYGTPTTNYVQRGNYLVSPNGATRSATWTLERLTPALLVGRGNRTGMDFKPDAESIPEARATSASYAGSGFDKGHLAASANHPTSSAMLATYNFANCAPEVPDFNQRVWSSLESHVRDIAHTADETWIITAPIYTPSPGTKTLTIQFIGPDVVSVPPFVGKAILVKRGDMLEMQAWIIPNKSGNSPNLDSFRVTTDQFESRLGCDCWSKLPVAQQTALGSRR